jgi:CrcB protein
MVGAPARYLIDRAVTRDSVFPWGTLTVNVIGSFLLGFLAASATASSLFHFLGTGLCGALTTYSTFGYETVRLLQDGARQRALSNVVVSILAGLAAAYGGLALSFA